MSTLIDFVMRSDSLTQHGGDIVQVREYMSLLERRGYDIRIEPFRPGMNFREGSIVQIVNIDRPFDYIEAMHLAKGHKVIVSPIHHDLSSVRAMRRANTGEGVRSHMRRILPEGIAELLAYLVRNVRSMKPFDVNLSDYISAAGRALTHAPNVWKRVGGRLDASHAVALLANTEAETLKKDACWSGANGHLVPNGAPDRSQDNSAKPWIEREIPIICVGRIEPRKRQAEVAEAARELHIPISFIGPLATPGSEYSQRFADAVTASDTLNWLGNLPHDEVIAMYGNSRVLLNASWVEVQSLVDIEAATAGCHVVNVGSGSSKEWLEGSVLELPAGDVVAAVKAAQQLSNRQAGPSGVTYDWTWKCAVDELEILYSR